MGSKARIILNKMKNITKAIFAICNSLLITSCTVTHKPAESEQVRLIFSKEFELVLKNADKCSYLGEIIGSDGHWYDYLFISNTRLTQGAFNNLRNKAYALGANIVYVDDDIGFSTSVTFYGQAYACDFGH